jgi:hypothetical protein
MIEGRRPGRDANLRTIFDPGGHAGICPGRRAARRAPNTKLWLAMRTLGLL